MPCVCALRRESRPRWRACFVLRRVDSGRTLSVAYGDSSPEGRALGKEDRFRPHPSTAGRSLPLSGKLYAPAKASPFRERWHGEAVTERVVSGRTLSVAYGDSSPEGRALGRTGRSRPHRSTAGRSLPLSCKLLALAKASPFRERWHGEAVTERVLCLSAVGKDSLARFPLKTVQKNAPVCYTSLCASGFCAAAQFCGGEKPPKTTFWWFLDGVQGLRRVGTAGCPMGRSGRRSFSGENDCSTWNIETFPGRGRNRAWQRSLRSQTKRAV